MFTRKRIVFLVVFVVVSIFVSSALAEGVWTTHFPIRNEENQEFYVDTACVAADNVIWFGADKGVFSYDSYGGVIYDRNSKLPDPDVNAVVADNSDIKWFGTPNGLSKLDDTNKPSWTWQNYTTDDGLVSNYVTSLAVDKNNILWVGTDKGISSFNGVTWTTYAEMDGLGISAMCVDSDNVLWVGTNMNGVFQFDGNTWMNYTKEDGIVFGIAGGMVTSITVDSNNVIWVGTGGSVSSFDGATWTAYTIENGLPDYFVQAVAVDANNTLWVGMIRGLASFDGTSWTTYTTADGLVDNDVLAILVDNNNVKWLMTNNGICTYDDRADTSTKKLTVEIIKTLFSPDAGRTSHPILHFTASAYGRDIMVGQNAIKFIIEGDVGRGDLSNFRLMRQETQIAETVLDMTSNNEVIFNLTVPLRIQDMSTVEFCLYADVGLNAKNKIYMVSIQNPRDFLGVDDDGDLISPLADQWPFSPKTFITISDIRTSVEESEETSQSINIRGNYPNPFNPTTTIEFSLIADNPTTISIYNLAGQKIKELVNGELTVGNHSVVWDGRDDAGLVVSSGMYLCRITAGSFASSHKLTLAK